MSGNVLRCAIAAGVLLAGSSAWAATNLITDGDFSSPNQSGGWTIYYPGTNGWASTNGDGVEIGTSPIYGLPCVNASCQNLEIDANNFDTIGQTISGLTAGASYTLSFLYGGRTSGGPDALDVYFDGAHLTTASGSVGVWTPYSFTVAPTGSTADLVFVAQNLGGLPSYGNEITNASLTAAPEASTWAMMALGFAGLGFAAFRKRHKSQALAV
jgi:hypothetical protein